MPGKNKLACRTCPKCGRQHVAIRNACTTCEVAVKGYRTDTCGLTYHVKEQPIRIRHERLQRLRAHAARMQRSLNP